MNDTSNDNPRELRPRMEKIFFSAGDLVTLKQELPNKPVMLVQTVDKIPMKEGDRVSLLGVTCIWFSVDHAMHKCRFNTKDIKKVEND